MIKLTSFSLKILVIARYYVRFSTQSGKCSLFFLSPQSCAKVSNKNLLKRKGIIKKTIFSILFFFYSSILYAEKIGFVDMETLINNSPQISNSRQTLNTEFESQYQDIEQKEADLERLENRITKDGAIMSLTELGQLQERARILERQTRRAKEDLKDAISIRNNQMLSEIQRELTAVVTQYAKDNKFDMILINSILYVSDEMNVTQEILQVLKEKSKKNEN